MGTSDRHQAEFEREQVANRDSSSMMIGSFATLFTPP